MSMNKTPQQWVEQLGETAYEVCRLGSTEAPFSGTLLHNKQQGYYHCVCCGEGLFSSAAKFDSGCGWPSFDQAKIEGNIKTVADSSHGMQRTEVRCNHCDAHLGHLFDDGPTETGLRYCINSVALKFTTD